MTTSRFICIYILGCSPKLSPLHPSHIDCIIPKPKSIENHFENNCKLYEKSLEII